jgi:hypothetical protein
VLRSVQATSAELVMAHTRTVILNSTCLLRSIHFPSPCLCCLYVQVEAVPLAGMFGLCVAFLGISFVCQVSFYWHSPPGPWHTMWLASRFASPARVPSQPWSTELILAGCGVPCVWLHGARDCWGGGTLSACHGLPGHQLCLSGELGCRGYGECVG